MKISGGNDMTEKNTFCWLLRTTVYVKIFKITLRELPYVNCS